MAQNFIASFWGTAYAYNYSYSLIPVCSFKDENRVVEIILTENCFWETTSSSSLKT